MNLPRWSIALFIFFAFSGCVSVSLNKGEVRRSEVYHWVQPGGSYAEKKSADVDRAWQNPRSGSIISVLSECTEEADPSLKILRDEVIRSLTEPKIEMEKNFAFQGREALRSQVQGRVDGVESAVDLVVLKKNGCAYILGLVATPTSIGPERPYFEEFIKGFVVP